LIAFLFGKLHRNELLTRDEMQSLGMNLIAFVDQVEQMEHQMFRVVPFPGARRPTDLRLIQGGAETWR
jgi:hypothetical protein